MFHVNDYIVYGGTGVCKIKDICKKRFAGIAEREYYIISPVYEDSSTIYVPTDNLNVIMRRILSVDEVYALIKSMPDEADIWIDDPQLREAEFSAIIKNGDRKELIKLIRSLYHNRMEQVKNGKKFHFSDEKLMKAAEKLLYDEFALVLDIKPEEVVPFILEEIEIKGAKGNNG